MADSNIVEVFTTILAWILIGYLASLIYKKQQDNSKVWKIIIILLVGIFSFSFNWNVLDTIIQISVLPLGVWFLYIAFKGKSDKWKKYRSFAWLGFFANYIFLISTLIAMPINYLLYPEYEPATYISRVENALIINTHPSAKKPSLIKEGLLKQVHRLKEAEIHSDEWYNEMYMDTEPSKRKERFPYMLINTSPKWGSGLSTIVYIEGDGKGLLIVTPKKEFYFRSDESLFKEGK